MSDWLQLSTFGRCEYEKTCQLLISLFDQAAQSYQELVRNTSASTTDMAIQEGTVYLTKNSHYNVHGYAEELCKAQGFQEF